MVYPRFSIWYGHPPFMQTEQLGHAVAVCPSGYETPARM